MKERTTQALGKLEINARVPEISCECCILGAGPAGLGTALELCKHGTTDILIIDRNRTVGGLARTERAGKVRFDIGPHRFFTRNREISNLWHDALGPDFKPVERLTRIYYDGRFFNYPLNALDVLSKLSPLESLHAVCSLVLARPGKRGEPNTFEEWMTQKFGRKLYRTFFKTYTEKLWGIPCYQLGAEWVAQRIKELNLLQTIRDSVFRRSDGKVKTLADQFHYPVLGSGQMYEAIADGVVSQGVEIRLGSRVACFNRQDTIINSVDVIEPDGERVRISASVFFNSIPITHFFRMLNPPESESVRQAADLLYYRDHVAVNLLVDGDGLFPDQWLYIHSPHVQALRIVNYSNFSKAMAGVEGKTVLGVEYFTSQTEKLWNIPDQSLKGMAVDDLARLRLLDRNVVERAWVSRSTESYPVYYLGFQEPYSILRSALDRYTNLYPIGRSGMYKYSNQDYSTMSGILAARNYLRLPDTPHNLWDINTSSEYLEKGFG